ncbi:MAG: RNA-binding S4 domain-containing protein [Rhodospirillaceae bacterium]|nr:RNA-binding S4 domain-containing protein [Rhodospirillaceae bacterium]MBL6941355.1 RNA-binding S4 domain-containing protein [Rhodospirillales bacterium]
MSDETLRIDKWLWYARFFKSRTLATRLCVSGKLVLNNQFIRKGHATLKEGDKLTFPKNDDIRVIRVVSLSTRRGPASEAMTLYEDLQPPQPAAKRQARRKEAVAMREPGSGRPTKAERRAIDKLRDHD